MLRMMNETKESLGCGMVGWSAEAVDFVKAISSAFPVELSDVSIHGPFPTVADGMQARLRRRSEAA